MSLKDLGVYFLQRHDCGFIDGTDSDEDESVDGDFLNRRIIFTEPAISTNRTASSRF